MTAFVARIAASPPAAAFVVIALAAGSVAIATRLLGLTLTGALALYFLAWWILLFAVLPFGHARRESDPEVETIAGSDPGAPRIPRLAEKAVWTSIVATVAYLALVAALPLAGL